MRDVDLKREYGRYTPEVGRKRLEESWQQGGGGRRYSNMGLDVARAQQIVSQVEAHERLEKG